MATRCELVYGRSGSGKTTWFLNIARRIWQEQGKKTRLYIGDGGLETVDNSGLIDAGIVEVFQFNVRPNPFDTVRFMCEGAWPSDPSDPLSPLVGPPQTGIEAIRAYYKKLGAEYGLFVFEGLSVIADYLMGDTEGGLAYRSARGEKIGQDSPISFTDGTTKVGGNPIAHYNVAQNAIKGAIERSRALPGWVQWTAHERLVEGDKMQGTVVGPDCAGKAMTTTVGAMFGNTTHLAVAHKKVKTGDQTTNKQVEQILNEYRAYTTEHHDPDGVVFHRYYANNRCPVINGKNPMPEYITPPDPIRFYQILTKAKMDAAAIPMPQKKVAA